MTTFISHLSPGAAAALSLFTLLVVIVLGYASLLYWIANTMVALRRRKVAAIVCLLAVPVILLIVAPYLAPSNRAILGEIIFIALTAIVMRFVNPGDPMLPLKETKPAALHLALLSGSSLFLIPFVWMLITSVKEESQINVFPPQWIPTQQVSVNLAGKQDPLSTMMYQGKRVQVAEIQQYPTNTVDVQILDQTPAVVVPHVPRAELTQVRHFAPLWSNYENMIKSLPDVDFYGLVNLKNTLTIAIMCVIGTVISSSLVAFAFSRLRWPGRDLLFGLVLATMMLPDAVLMLPRYLIFVHLHWIDTLYPLWFPTFFASAFNVFLLRQFFLGIPQEMEDAAKIDGCSYFAIYWRIMMPMIKPALAAITVMQFIAAWKDFLNPLIYISSPEKMPLSYLLQSFNGQHTAEPAYMMAATTLVMLPVVILFFFTQRYFVEGVTISGLGGR